MKKILSLILTVVLVISNITAIAEQSTHFVFSDLGPSSSSGYMNVMSLYRKGIIEGKTETKFYPDDPITRSEAAKVIVLASGADLVSKTGSYTDVVPGSWYEPYVETALSLNLMQGKGDGYFGVDENISRQDAALLALRLAEYKGVVFEDRYDYTITDANDIADYAKAAVETCFKMNIVDPIEGAFKPREDITRLNFCEFIDRVLVSDVNAYDDFIQSKMPVDKPIEEYDVEVVAFEDFENGITMRDYEATVGGTAASNILDYSVGKDSSGSIKLSGKDGASFSVYLDNIEANANYYFSYDAKAKGLGSGYLRAYYTWYGVSNYGNYDRNGDIKNTNDDWETRSFKGLAPTPDFIPRFCRISFHFEGGVPDGAEAWIDNLKIYKTAYHPLVTVMTSPSYKGFIFESDGESDIVVNTYISGIGTLYTPEEIMLEADITDAESNVIVSTVKYNPTEEMTVSFSSKDLDIGNYYLTLRLKNIKTGKIHGENYWVLRKREPDYRPEHYFDEYGRLVKNGKPVFMFGSYAIGLEKTGIEDFKDTPIYLNFANSKSRFWSARQLMDEMAENNQAIMFPTESMYANSMRAQFQDRDITNRASERAILERAVLDRDLINDPAHGGYLINDELPVDEYSHLVQWHNEILSEIDPDHPTFGVNVGSENYVRKFWRSHDIYSADPYPIAGADTDQIWAVYENGKGIDNATKNRPFWMVLQISDLKVMGGSYADRERGPNITELRNMAWQAVCAGTQGICWYAHFDLNKEGATRPKDEVWSEVVQVSEEVATFEDAILSRDDAPNVRIIAGNTERFCSTVRRYNGKTYIFMANMSKDAQNVTVETKGIKSVEYAYNSDNSITDDTIDLTLEGLGVEVMIIDQEDYLSPDCELDELQFYSGDNRFFVSIDENISTVWVPEGTESISYSAKINPKARLFTGTCPASVQGVLQCSDKDEVVFKVVAEDGSAKEYKYKLVREVEIQ